MSDQVHRELKLRNEAYDFLNTFRGHALADQAFDYLADAISDEKYSNSELKAIASGLRQCIEDRNE